MANKYSNTFLDIFKNETIKDMTINQNNLNLLKAEINQWLQVKQQLDNRLERRLEELEKEEKRFGVVEIISLTGRELRSLVNNYTNLHRKMKEIQDIDDITNHFKNGYRLIEKARELFTGQEITYSIIYSGEDKSSKNIYEANLTMEQLLPHLSLTMREISDIQKNRQKLTNSMQIYLSGSTVAKAAAEAIERDKDNCASILSKIKNPSLWDSLADFQVNKYQGIFNKEKNTYYKGNLGRLYEVYTNLMQTDRGQKKGFSYIGHLPGDKNTIGLASTLLDKAISDSVPFYQSGDYGLVQLKAVLGGSTRGLVNVETIENVLQNLSYALAAPTKEELINSITNIFTPSADKIDTAIDEEVREQAIETIKNKIREANLDIN